MQSLIVKVFSTMTGKRGALCLVPLLQHSYLLAPPSLRSEAEEEDVAHCINKSPQCTFLGLHVPPTHLRFSLLKQCSVLLCAHQCWHRQNSPSLRNTLSKTGLFLHNQTCFSLGATPQLPAAVETMGPPAATSCVCQTRIPNTDSSEQPLLCPCSSGPGTGQAERERVQHFSPLECTGKGE